MSDLVRHSDIEELTFNRARVDNVHARCPKFYILDKKLTIRSLRIQFQKDSNLEFACTVMPSTGPYKGGAFVFQFTVGETYPFSPPSVRCTTRIFHPNIRVENGAVALKILRREWKPVYTINTVVREIQLLFLKPDLGNPVNLECASMVQNRFKEFEEAVVNTMRGGFYFGCRWESVHLQRGQRKRDISCRESSANKRSRLSNHIPAPSVERVSLVGKRRSSPVKRMDVFTTCIGSDKKAGGQEMKHSKKRFRSISGYSHQDSTDNRNLSTLTLSPSLFHTESTSMHMGFDTKSQHGSAQISRHRSRSQLT
eukprot:100685-Amorphochlora_amoeboformis.AAC.1